MLSQVSSDSRLRTISIVFLLLATGIVARLFALQILQHEYYSTFALNNHEIYEKLHPRRGQIYFKDDRTGDEYAAAVNRQYHTVYAVPKDILKSDVGKIAEKISEIFAYDETKKNSLREKLSKENDPYEPIEKKVTDEIMQKIEAEKFTGIFSVMEEQRFYPENELASSILGFYGFDKDGNPTGRYGVEGYWEKILAGKGGFLMGEMGAKGSWIPLAGRISQDAENGADIILTIDRALEYNTCEMLKKGWEEYGAKSATMIMMDPKTGAVLAMCSFPDFNPNEYSKVEDFNSYNNTAVYTPYEPGSVFKPLTMAMGIDQNLLDPHTTFTDPCERKIDDFTIHNALDKCYGKVTMTEVLEKSINTGMIWVEEKLGIEKFRHYLDKFGFGQKTGIGIDTESAGDISPLQKKSAIYGAVASFGQGFTATPIQLAVAYSALANEGFMPKPYVVSEIRRESGIEKTEPVTIDQVVSARTAKLITGMMVSVVEEGHGQKAKLDKYFLAGKTGTAQIPGKGGYSEETNHTFCGYAPANNPKFVLVVKFEAPQRDWAEETALPVFKDIAEFALKYYGVKGDR